MRVSLKYFFVAIATCAAICPNGFSATEAALPHYLITNNDFSQGNSATFFAISGGTLTQTAVVNTGGKGNDGIGSVATKRISVLRSHSQSCAFVADASTNDVAGITIPGLTVSGTFKGSGGDTGTAAGIGVVNNGSYLYASFTGSDTLGTFQILANCQLSFIGDTTAMGISGFPVLDMAAYRNILVVSYQDGSIESFNISSGLAISNGDLQYSTGHSQNNTVAGVDIDASGHFAAFGGSANPAVIETSDISSGKLTPTAVFSNLGPNTGSEAIHFSPDNSRLYFSGFNSGVLSAAHFDQATGSVTKECTSATLKGGNDQAGLATSLPTGSGGVLYVAEPETSIGIVRIVTNGSECQLIESSQSPVHDGNTITLESIGVYPPRSF